MTDSDGKSGHTGGTPACRTGEADDAAASYSNYAVAAKEIAHTVAGPGTCIYSTWMGSGYNTISGTSMATPHVSGTVALCFGSGGVAGPCAGMTPAQVITKIRNDAQAAATTANGFAGDPNAPNGSRYYGYLVSASGY
jgi:subtilisin family serine protease